MIIRVGPCSFEAHIPNLYKYIHTTKTTLHVTWTSLNSPISPIAMSTSSRCIAAAARSAPTARIAQRTVASHISNLATSLRTAPGGNGICLRELQRARMGAGSTASGLACQMRGFSQSTSRSKLKTIDQIRARNKGGVRPPFLCLDYVQQN